MFAIVFRFFSKIILLKKQFNYSLMYFIVAMISRSLNAAVIDKIKNRRSVHMFIVYE